jgi:hypothetical protein
MGRGSGSHPMTVNSVTHCRQQYFVGLVAGLNCDRPGRFESLIRKT